VDNQSRTETARVKEHVRAPASYLNLGCGERCHPEWVNIDLAGCLPGVIQHDISKGIPFPDRSFSVVYHSHLLEHLRKEHALAFLRECHRVLKCGGILRVVVPNLEQIVRCYLSCLEKALRDQEPESHLNYEWMMLELYDQAVRTRCGGLMARYVARPSVPNLSFVANRIGPSAMASCRPAPIPPFRQRIEKFVRQRGVFLTSRHVASKVATLVRDAALKVVLGSDFEKLQLGRFRASGEIHEWMYDRHSLKILQEQAGFCQVRVCSAVESGMEGWPEYCLDTNLDGSAYKPDSLYMEATKPE